MVNGRLKDTRQVIFSGTEDALRAVVDSMPEKRDYYDVLGVLPSAEIIVIRAAFRALAQKYHPDKWRGNKAESEARMRELNEAYETLSNDDKRRKYDSQRKPPNDNSF